MTLLLLSCPTFFLPFTSSSMAHPLHVSDFSHSVLSNFSFALTLRLSNVSSNLSSYVLDQGLTNGPHSGFVSKIMLEHSHVHLCAYRLWLISCYHVKVE